MQYLAALRRRTEAHPAERFTDLLDAEADRVRELYAAGIIREVFSRGDVLGAVLRLEAPDEEAARAAVASLPLFAHDMLELQLLVPLLPFRAFVPQ
jgi:muconolactone delta-isomerase